jgi:flagellar protein FlaF
MRRLEASKAYQSASQQRGLRDQEADVFRRVNTMLRCGQQTGGVLLSRALADNGRLWITLLDHMRDPDNALPLPLRASIISVGLAVQREAACEEPDVSFLVGINDQVALGLTGQ